MKTLRRWLDKTCATFWYAQLQFELFVDGLPHEYRSDGRWSRFCEALVYAHFRLGEFFGGLPGELSRYDDYKELTK